MAYEHGAEGDDHWGNEAAAHGFGHKGRAAINAQLVHSSFDSALNRARRESVSLSDLFVSMACGNGYQACQLALGQSLA
ncbi:hypothetical protein O165_005420 [Pseudomonas soli]|nr:hypothetical protein O165_005420 [Pseudomonas soli]